MRQWWLMVQSISTEACTDHVEERQRNVEREKGRTYRTLEIKGGTLKDLQIDGSISN